jgi:site-specific DNA-adenine methylase
MAYFGGKSKCYSHIIYILNKTKNDNKIYLETFVGMCHILRRVINKKKYIASDINENVCCLLKGIQQKKEYTPISKKKYYTLKEQVEAVREMISIEPDDFEQQFIPQ